MLLHICTHERGGVPTLTSKHGVASLGYAIYVPMHEGVNQVCNTSIVIMYNLLRSMCGMSFTATEVCFTHSRPSDIKPYESFFQAPLLFEADENAIVFPDHCLKTPLPANNRKKYNDVIKQLTTIESGMDFDIGVSLPMILRPLVVSKACTPEHIASLLSLHPRTLNRRLEDCGMTLRGMLGEIRFDIAKQLLAESSVSLIKIAILLGYADSSAFTHAFRRWSGMSPSAWRMQNRQNP